MTGSPAAPLCPLCGGAAWRRERFFALAPERPTVRVVVQARCAGCGLRRYFWPAGEEARADGIEGAADPVRFLADARARGGLLDVTVANGGLLSLVRFAPPPPGRLWLFSARTLRRAAAAAGWTHVRTVSLPMGATIRAQRAA